MNIHLINYRCYTDSKFCFDSNKITLISGKSGVGKSSILSGIYWCLYKSIKGVYNSAKEKEKTSVTLNFPNMKIHRQAKPGLLQVTIKSVIYEDVIAQNIINSHFGNKDFWKSCSYIEQNSRCYLLSGSDSNILNLLNMLAFSEFSPDSFIDKIEEKLDTEKNRFKTNCEILKIKNKEFEEDFKECDIKKEHVNFELDEKNVNELENIKSVLEKKSNENSINKGKLYVLNKQLAELSINNIENVKSVLIETKEKIEELTKKEKLNVILKEQQIKVESEKIFLKNQLNDLHLPSTVPHIVSSYDLSLMNEELNVVEDKYKENIKNTNNKSFLMAQLKTKDEKLLKISKKDIDFLKTKIKKLEDKYNKSVETNKIVDKIQNIENRLKILVTNTEIRISKEELENIKILERDYEKNMSIAIKFHLEYNKTFIQDEILIVKRFLEKEEKIKNKKNVVNQLMNYENEISKFEFKPIEINLNSLQKVYEEKKKGLNVLLCPHCEKGIRYISEKLVKENCKPCSEIELKNIESEIEKIKKQIEINKNYLRIKNIIELLISQCDDIPIDEIKNHNSEISDFLNKKLKNMEEISIIELPKINFENALNNFTYWELTDELSKLQNYDYVDLTVLKNEIFESEKQLFEWVEENSLFIQLESQKFDLLKELSTIVIDNSINEKYLNLKSDISKLEIHLKEYDSYKEIQKKIFSINQKIDLLPIIDGNIESHVFEIENLNKYVIECENVIKYNNIVEEINSIQLYDNIEKEIEENFEKIKNIKYIINNTTLYSNMKIRHNKLKETEINLKQDHKKILSISKLKDFAIDLEYKRLQFIVNTINGIVSEILSILFEESISVSLQLFKELKTNKRNKPLVNVSIKYKGNIFDGVNHLSGGEGDRISLAFLIAVNKISFCPLILLDECVSSLDENTRSQCINLLKTFMTKDKIAICINHNDIEGEYDNVLSLK